MRALLLGGLLGLPAACHSGSHAAPTPTPAATPAGAAGSGAYSGPVTDAELAAAVRAAGCGSFHLDRDARRATFLCGEERRDVALPNLDRQLDGIGDPAARDARVRAFLALGAADAGGGDDAPPAKLPRDRILPALKSREAIDATLSRIPDEMRGRISIPTQPLAGRVVMTIVIDEPRRMGLVTSQELGLWNTDADTLAALAVQNLASRPSPRPRDDSQGGPKIVLVNSGDSYDAARILVPETRTRIAEALDGGRVFFAIPDRDHLLAARADDDAAVSALRERAANIYAAGNYAITDELLTYDEGTWGTVP